MHLGQDWEFFEARRHDVDNRKKASCQLLRGGANSELILAGVVSRHTDENDCHAVDMRR